MGTSFGRGGATTFQQDLQHADVIVIEGSNMAEAHPVGFQWVMEAKQRGATIIHVDPRFSRTSALADIHVALRAGTDIAFLGGLINYVLTRDRAFREYVLAYTNAATLISNEYVDAEDLGGVFSGFDPASGTYDPTSWRYSSGSVAAAAGVREHAAAYGETSGALGGRHGTKPDEQDPTLEHPRCVYQILKRHFARYTPEMVVETCGIRPELFERVAQLLCDNSGPDRTGAFCYAVGWTHHSVGVQYIRTAAILQTLLGNIGRPGGGILALRGHASIQGSTDIPTLFNLLPGYIPMPHAEHGENLNEFLSHESALAGFWSHMDDYLVSLLKAWWGDAATAENDFAFGYLPRLTGDHSSYQTVLGMLDGSVTGFFALGENPAVGSGNSRMHRLALAKLDWLVVRDFQQTETAAFWYDSQEIETGELRSGDIATEVFLMPAAAHTEKDGSFTQTQRLLQWHDRAVEPVADQRSELWFAYHLGRIIRQKLAGSPDDRDRPLLDLTWEYPTVGRHDDPDAEAVLAEINGWDSNGAPLSSYTQLKDDGSTRCGCWIYCGCRADGVNQTRRRRPGSDQDWVAAEWGWAWPANRRILYNRASAGPDGRPWSDRKRYVYWDREQNQWTGPDVPDFPPATAPDYRPPPDATGEQALSGQDPFIMQSDGKAWLFAPAGLRDGPLPTHYEPFESPVANPLYRQRANPAIEALEHPANPANPTNGASGDAYPFVLTTYRLTEHHTAGAMSRTVGRLSALQPELFCEVSPELAELRGLEHGGWATLVTARAAVEARVLVTRRITPLHVRGQVVHQIGIPYHWGRRGLSTGDSPNDLLGLALDPNVHIQDTKALTCDVIAGRRPRGPAVRQFVAAHRGGGD